MAFVCKMKFGTMSGVKTWTFTNWDSDVTTQQVRNLAQAMISNGSVYKYPPLTVESARLIETRESEYVMS